MKNMKKVISLLAVCLYILLALSCCAYASGGLALRLHAPHFIAAGDVFTAKIAVQVPAGKRLCALAVTTVWDASVLTPVGEMRLSPEILSETAGETGFDTVLINKTNIEKGINELALGKMSKDKDFALAGSIVIAEQEFKIKSGASGTTRIGFTTNYALSANGTSAFTGDGELPFTVITPAVISVK